MARITVDLPNTFPFTTSIPVRITDLNYGGHVGNDTILSLIHEARMRFLVSEGLSEKDFSGTGLIMGDVAISFKNELFYGDVVDVSVAVGEIARVSFDIFYKLEKQTENKKILIAEAKTGMICYNYEKRKVSSIPAGVLSRWEPGGVL